MSVSMGYIEQGRKVQPNPSETIYSLQGARTGTEGRPLEALLPPLSSLLDSTALRGFDELMAVIVAHLEDVSFAKELEAREAIAEATYAARRAREHLRVMLGAAEDRAVIDPRETLRDLRPLLDRLVGPDVTLLVHADTPVGTLRATRRQIEEVVLSLVANAVETMPEGGIVELRLLSFEAGTGASPSVVIEVTDSGEGVDESLLEGDSFGADLEFLSAQKRRMVVVHAIVEQLGGGIDIRSRWGEGSSFAVYLPRLEDRLAP